MVGIVTEYYKFLQIFKLTGMPPPWLFEIIYETIAFKMFSLSREYDNT